MMIWIRMMSLTTQDEPLMFYKHTCVDCPEVFLSECAAPYIDPFCPRCRTIRRACNWSYAPLYELVGNDAPTVCYQCGVNIHPGWKAKCDACYERSWGHPPLPYQPGDPIPRLERDSPSITPSLVPKSALVPESSPRVQPVPQLPPPRRSLPPAWTTKPVPVQRQLPPSVQYLLTQGQGDEDDDQYFA